MTEHSTELVTAKPRDRGLQITGEAGGIAFGSMTQIIEFAQLMAKAEVAIPKFLRLNIGACIAVTMQAVEWEMTPFQVANKSYSVNDRLAFESQLMHAVILKRAPIKGRLKVEYLGEGPTRQCHVWVYLRDDVAAEPNERVDYTSPMFKDITTKNSPLWKADPDQQFFYYASRALCRRHFPDVLLGVYSREEMQEAEPIKIPGTDKEAGNRLADRLAAGLEADRRAGAAAEGFAPGVVEKGIAGEIVDRETGEVSPAETYESRLLDTARATALMGRPVFDPWFNALLPEVAAILKDHMPSLLKAAGAAQKASADKAAKIIEHEAGVLVTDASIGSEVTAAGYEGDLEADNGEREALRFDFDAELADFIKMIGTFTALADLEGFANAIQSDKAAWFHFAPESTRAEAMDKFADAQDALKRRAKAEAAAEAKAAKAAAAAEKAAQAAALPPQGSNGNEQPDAYNEAARVRAEGEAADPELAALIEAGDAAAKEGVRRLKFWRGGKINAAQYEKVKHLMAGWDSIAKAADEAL